MKVMDFLKLNVQPFPAVNGMMGTVGQLLVRINVCQYIKVMEKRYVKVMDFLKLNVWPFLAVNGMMGTVGQLLVRINVC